MNGKIPQSTIIKIPLKKQIQKNLVHFIILIIEYEF